jgi:hypothetical protein
MSSAPPYDPYEAFLIAEAFRNSWQILRSQFGEDIPQHFNYVIATNAAFSLELYLKCLLVIDGQTPKANHNLKLQFDALPPNNRDAIRTGYADILKTDRYLQEQKMRLKEEGKNPDKIFRFESVLNESALAFEKSRYPFDPRYKVHTYLAEPIERATRKVIVAIHPSWDRAFRNLLRRQGTLPKSQVR